MEVRCSRDQGVVAVQPLDAGSCIAPAATKGMHEPVRRGLSAHINLAGLGEAGALSAFTGGGHYDTAVG